MKRTLAASLGAVVIAAAIGWVALAVAQAPSRPAPMVAAAPRQPRPEPPLPRPVLPGHTGTIAPLQPNPNAPAPGTPALPVPAPPVVQTAAQSLEGPELIPPLVLPTTTVATGRPDAPVSSATSYDGVIPANRQESSVTMEWIGPNTAKASQANDYALIVRNVGQAEVQQVQVRVRLAGNATVLCAEPQPTTEENRLRWDVGILLPKQERNLQLRLSPPAHGEIEAQAWVTFTGATSMRVKVAEPKLSIRAVPPAKITVGDIATFTLMVTNPGDGVAEQVKLHADLAEGLEHGSGRRVEFEIGNLDPGESRTVLLQCLARAGGEQACQVVAEADRNLKADARAVAVVVSPRIELDVKGPKLRYLDRKATYTFKVTNPGDAAVSDVTLCDVVPAGFKVVAVDNGGKHDEVSRAVSWRLGEIGPGQSREVTMDLLCANSGEFTHNVVAQAAHCVKSECEVTTRVEGLSAIQLAVADLADPVEVNGETTYEMRLTNTGTTTESAVNLACTLPLDKMKFESAAGPSTHRLIGNEVVFDPLPQLAPKAEAVYKVTVKCTAPGIALFKARMTSAVLTEPVTKEESTRIYAD